MAVEQRPALDEALALYEAVGWTVYTREPEVLARAIAGSTWVAVVREQGRLVALARCVSDDATFAWLQDVLVHPEHRRRGHGRVLVEAALARFAHCRQFALMTDDRPEQTAFYESLGLVRLDKATTATLRTFARMPGLS